jgi:hypothetical protein
VREGEKERERGKRKGEQKTSSGLWKEEEQQKQTVKRVARADSINGQTEVTADDVEHKVLVEPGGFTRLTRRLKVKPAGLDLL